MSTMSRLDRAAIHWNAGNQPGAAPNPFPKGTLEWQAYSLGMLARSAGRPTRNPFDKGGK